MIIVKIGGSVFSDKKGKEGNVRMETIREIAKEMREFYPNKSFIVVHGGGSFGHPLARRYRIREGLKEEISRKMIGASLTHQAMLSANDIIVRTFLDEGLPAFSVSTSSIFTSRKGRVSSGYLKTLEKLLKLKFIPILFGDVVIDEEKGVDVLSGDQVITYLTKKLKPEKVVFMMDVDGIYRGEPGAGELLSRISRHEALELIKELRCQEEGDVTGGICNKLMEAVEISRQCDVWFVNGLVGGRLRGALRGNGVGTYMSRSQSI